MIGFMRMAVGLAFVAFAATAQNYPSAPVKLIVPVPAGGVTDVMARILRSALAGNVGTNGCCRESAGRKLWGWRASR